MSTLPAAITLLATLSAENQTKDVDTKTLSKTMISKATALGETKLVYGRTLNHHAEHGFPENKTGQLVISRHSEGPMVQIKGKDIPFLLYAQVQNRQRDAVFLARTGSIEDPLPNGEKYDIPFGYGALKRNTVTVSTIESLLLPHFSDNQKDYVLFPITDLYVGGGISTSGLSALARYVHHEQYAITAGVGVNPFGSLNEDSFSNRHWAGLNLGAGYRFPGLFPEQLGKNLWTIGPDIHIGLGDKDNNPNTWPLAIMPGIMLNIERVLYDEEGVNRDFRQDPRPYNYKVNSLSFNLGAHLNLTSTGNWILPTIGLTYQFNLIGPKIPDHQFKETMPLYLHPIYQKDLERQTARQQKREPLQKERSKEAK